MRDGASWESAAAESLANLGFTLINSDRPAAVGGPKLLVGLRAKPTLRHFDPEVITCWVAAEGRGRPLAIDRDSATGDRPVSWGHIHVVDRLGVENRFLTFGGPIRVADVNAGLRVVEHASPGPIVRWGGHSQGSDALAGEIGAFFGRLIVPVDYLPGGEARIASEPPEHLYGAFLRDVDARRRRADRRLESDREDPLGPWIGSEISRVQAHQPAWWAAAGVLLHDLGFAPGGAGAGSSGAGVSGR